jgi:hypothetical protein
MRSFHLSIEWLWNIMQGLWNYHWANKSRVPFATYWVANDTRSEASRYGCSQPDSEWFLQGTSVLFWWGNDCKAIWFFEISKWPRNDPLWSFTTLMIQISYGSIAITVAPSSANTQHKWTWQAKCIHDDGQTIDAQRKMKSTELD